jgi:hypothetical protein
MIRHRTHRMLALAALFVVSLFGLVFLAIAGIDALEGRSELQFFADSPTYHEAARGDLLHIDNLADMVGVAGNFLGPWLLIRLVGDSYYLILVLNAVLMGWSIASLSRSLQLDAVRLLGWLFLNPITLSSLLAVNKEVISLAVIALLVRALVHCSPFTLLLALVVSVLVRWQLTAVLVVASVMLAPVYPLTRRWGALAVLLGLLSVAYVQLAPVLEPIRATFELAAADYEGSGFYEWLVGLQDSGWYWLIFPIKAAHLLFGMGLRFDRLLAPVNLYNDVWQLLHSTSLLVMFLVLWRVRRLRLRNDLIYASMIYLAIFAITPIYTPRYFYPVYVLWALAACMPTSREALFWTRQPSRRRPAATPPMPGAPLPLPNSA